MAGELSFHMKDVYPDMGFMTTKQTTIPDPEDQQAMVDDQKLAQEQTSHSPASHKNILIAFAIGVLLIIFLGKVG